MDECDPDEAECQDMEEYEEAYWGDDPEDGDY